MKDLRILIDQQVKLGAIIPGSIREQYTVCGKTGCACRDKNNPRKHGPYNQLSFSTKGKSSTMFIKSPDLKIGKEMTMTYKEYRTLTQEIGLAMITLCRKEGLQEAKRIYNDLYEETLRKHLGEKSRPLKVKEMTVSRDKWKSKAVGRKSEIEKLQVKIRDIVKSRDSWKSKAMHNKQENQNLIKEITVNKKNFTEET